MNSYKVKVILEVIAENDYEAEGFVREAINETDVDIREVHIMSSEVYN